MLLQGLDHAWAYYQPFIYVQIYSIIIFTLKLFSYVIIAVNLFIFVNVLIKKNKKNIDRMGLI